VSKGAALSTYNRVNHMSAAPKQDTSMVPKPAATGPSSSGDAGPGKAALAQIAATGNTEEVIAALGDALPEVQGGRQPST
jgi:hypothetical protein